MMNNQDILELFSYSQDEQDTFPYIRRYMRRIQRHLPGLLEDAQARERFMLAGLFLTYRAFNHWGESMTTELDSTDIVIFPGYMPIKRIQVYKAVTGKRIDNTRHYLKMIRFYVFIMFLILTFGRFNMLYYFVRYGW